MKLLKYPGSAGRGGHADRMRRRRGTARRRACHRAGNPPRRCRRGAEHHRDQAGARRATT